ncbi:hypothetical protein V2V46_07695 [Streptococcus agalactiae]
MKKTKVYLNSSTVEDIGISPLLWGLIIFVSTSVLKYLSIKLSYFYFPTIIITFLYIFSILLILLNICYSKYIFPTRLQKIELILQQLLIINKWFIEDLNNNDNYVLHSAFFIFWRVENILYVSFYPNGLSIANQMDDITRILETSLNLSCESKDFSSPSCTTYIFEMSHSKNVLNMTEKWGENNE